MIAGTKVSQGEYRCEGGGVGGKGVEGEAEDAERREWGLKRWMGWQGRERRNS